MSLKRCLVAAPLVLLFALALAWAARMQLLTAMTRWLDVGERPRLAQYVMVLSGDEDTRPFVAAALIKAGLAREALVAQTPLPRSATDAVLPDTYDIVRRVLVERGVAPSAIKVLPGDATTTYDEARALATFLRQRPDARVLVVTNSYHTRRSRWIMARALADLPQQATIVAAPVDEFDINRWWCYETGFVTITAEYLKLAFYFVYYSRLGWWLAACAALALVACRTNCHSRERDAVPT